MGPIILAIMVILIGAAIRAIGPQATKGAAGAYRVVGYGFMFAGLALAFSNTVTVMLSSLTR